MVLACVCVVKVGGVVVTCSDRNALRVEDQDWSELTLEAFVPTATTKGSALLDVRRVVQRNEQEASHEITFEETQAGTMALNIETLATSETKSWVARFHLRQGQSFYEGDVGDTW